MGAYLDKPIEEKNPTHGKTTQCSWGACSMQGWRCSQEDAHVTKEIELADGKKGSLFCCFDGHGGKEVSLFSEINFEKEFMKLEEFKSGNYKEALRKAFEKTDDLVSKEDYCNDTGTTACVVFVTDSHIYCSNAGDSRGVLSRGNKGVIGLSEDHKPDNAEELARIEKAGHHVEDSRVDGNLALSRAFGDFQYKDQPKLSFEKQAVTCSPDVSETRRTKDDKFIILACDGIWDCLDNEQACKSMQTQIDAAKGPTADSDAVAKILAQILAPNTDDGIGTDNMTCILIQLNNDKI